MTAVRARRGLALLTAAAVAALALPTGVAQAARHRPSKPTSAEKIFVVPSSLTQLCVADSKPLQQALSTAWTPPPPSLDQWTSLARTMACDLSGARGAVPLHRSLAIPPR